MARIDFVRRKDVDSAFLKPSEILVTTKSKNEWYFMITCICTIQYWYNAVKKEVNALTYSRVLKFVYRDIEDVSKDISHKKDYPLTPWK